LALAGTQDGRHVLVALFGEDVDHSQLLVVGDVRPGHRVALDDEVSLIAAYPQHLASVEAAESLADRDTLQVPLIAQPPDVH
jgi:hypothetical protein